MSEIILTKQATTATPSSGKTAVYVKTDGLMYMKDDAGGEVAFSSRADSELASNKDASGGFAGLTLFKLNMRNVANTITSWFTNANTVARTYTLPDKDGTVAMTSDITGTNSGVNTGDNAAFVDTNPVVKGSVDATKQIRFEVDGLTTATTRVITAPDADLTLVGTATAQTLTNKTLTGYTETVYALSGTAIDPANGTVQTKTLGSNTTFTESLADGQSVVLMLNPATYTTTWPTTSWVNTAGSNTAPTLKASVVNVVVLWQVGGTLYGNWAGSL